MKNKIVSSIDLIKLDEKKKYEIFNSIQRKKPNSFKILIPLTVFIFILNSSSLPQPQIRMAMFDIANEIYIEDQCYKEVKNDLSEFKTKKVLNGNYKIYKINDEEQKIYKIDRNTILNNYLQKFKKC